MCISPITLKKDKLRHTYKESTMTDLVPCGKCVLCLKRRTNSWAFRLLQEVKISSSAIFLTLTYDNENLPLDNVTNTYIDYDTGECTDYHYKDVPVLDKSDPQKFLKRLRKRLKTSNIKYYGCGEYGNNRTKRPHYHFIMFNLPQEYIKTHDLLTEIWGKGLIHIGDCNEATIKYTTKYIMKSLKNKNTTLPPEFAIMSKYLGVSFLTPQMVQFYQNNPQSHVTLPGGIKTSLPRYFKEKIFEPEILHKLTVRGQIKMENYDTENFKNDNHKHEWKKDKIRQHENAIRRERDKL